MSFTQPVDIANRALQHCGATRIVTLQDDAKSAAEISECYDKLRRAELRRNVWRFAIRRAVLYPLNATAQPTMKLAPAPWDAGTVYDFGAIVYYSGRFWSSSAQVNVGQQPGAPGVTGWDTYFGNLCAQPWDSSLSYFPGDLVYITSGPDTATAFLSLVGSNSASPLSSTPWDAATTYNAGAVVQDAQGFYWRSLVNLNTASQPGVYGQWSSTATYATGEYAISSDYLLYQAIAGSTNHNPATGASPAYWLLIGAPGSWPQWGQNIAYAAGAVVAGADGKLYRALDTSTGVDPTTSPYSPLGGSKWYGLGTRAPWSAQFSAPTNVSSWLRLDAAIEPIIIDYPLGSGPARETETRNVFLLPNGFLREAPQDPKAGSTSYLGAPSGLQYSDWELEGDYIVSRQATPIIFRFVADVTQVPEMDDMFCEGLGCRIAAEVCETLTQSGSKLGAIASAYKTFMGDARTVNGIETGSVEPPEDDWITCRL